MQPVGHLDFFWVVVCLCVCARTVVVAKVIPNNKSIDTPTDKSEDTKNPFIVTDDDYPYEVNEHPIGEEEESYGYGGDLLYIPEDYMYAYGGETPDNSTDVNTTDSSGGIDIYGDEYYEDDVYHPEDAQMEFGSTTSVPESGTDNLFDLIMAEFARDTYNTYEDYEEDHSSPPGVKLPLIGDGEKIHVETKDGQEAGSKDDSHTSPSPGGGNINNTDRHWFKFLCLFPSLCCIVLYLD